MSSNMLLQRAVRLALLTNIGAASLGIPALAAASDAADGPQQSAAEAPADNTPTLTEVVVTGSRIATPGIQSISPVTTVSADAIKDQGVTKIEDLLNTLPQVVADQGSMSSNGASGTSTVNLRGLGPQRTLVLVNGRRLMPGDPSSKVPQFLAPDLNNIPVALVDRVDVLTGGASAVYGADAVAGVVNFVMNDHFQGVRIDANGSINQHSQHSPEGFYAPKAGDGSASSSVWDGASKDVTLIIGNNFADDKGNATMYVGYRKVTPVTQDTRDFSRCTLQTSGGGVVACGGSSNAPTARIYASNFGTGTADAVPSYFASPFLTIDAAHGQLVPWTNADAFNYGALNYYQRPDERWNGGAFAHYNWDDNHQVYGEFMFMSDHTIAQIAPSGGFIGSGTGINPNTGNPDGDWAVNCNNPYLTAQQVGLLCANSTNGTAQMLMGWRDVLGGNRQDEITHTSFRLVIGTKGEINDALSYDVYAQEGITMLSEEYHNDVDRNRLGFALQAVTDPATGNIICAANANGANLAPNCSPLNIWSGTPSQAAINYIRGTGFQEGEDEERIVSGNITADMGKYGVKSPVAGSGLMLNVGAEYREEFINLRPDQEYIGDGNLSNLSGQGSATLPINAGLHVSEGFFEARLPIVQDEPFVKDLTFETGYRYSSYTTGFNTNTYKFGVDWAPTSDLRVRGGYNRAVRAPNLTELYATKFVALDGSADPCAGSSTGSPAAATQTQCTNHGMTAAQYGKFGTPANPSGQYNGLVGGNPNLKPEIADTYTLGFVITPTAIPNLSATLDFFNIKIKDAITSYGANLIVDQCVLQNVASFCNSVQEGQAVGVHRDASGSLWFSSNGYVADPLLNLGYVQTRGVDFGSHYRLDMPGSLGHMNFAFNGTYTASFITEPFSGSGTYNCAGYYGATCGNPLPKWKHVFSDTWATPIPGLSVGMRWRFIGATKIELDSPSPLLATVSNKKIFQDWQEIPTFSYIDLTASYNFARGVTLRLGVNNVLDKDPPVLAATNTTYSLPPPFFNGNTYPQVYDTLGRFLFANVTIDF